MKFWSLLLTLTVLALQPFSAQAAGTDSGKSWDDISAQATKSHGPGELTCVTIADPSDRSLTSKALIFKLDNGTSRMLEKKSKHCLQKNGKTNQAGGSNSKGQNALCKMLGLNGSSSSVSPGEAGSSQDGKCSTSSLAGSLINLSRSMGGVAPGLKSCSVSGAMGRAQDAHRCAGEAEILSSVAQEEMRKGPQGSPCSPAATAVSRAVEAVKNCGSASCDERVFTMISTAVTRAKSACPPSP